MVDVTPAVPAGRQVVEAYGGGGFRVSGAAYRTYNILLAEERRVAAALIAIA